MYVSHTAYKQYSATYGDYHIITKRRGMISFFLSVFYDYHVPIFAHLPVNMPLCEMLKYVGKIQVLPNA